MAYDSIRTCPVHHPSAHIAPQISTRKQLLRDAKLIMIRNQLIPTLRRKDLSSHNNRACAEKANTPTDSAKDPRLVQFPANKEAILVVKQVRLQTRTVSLRFHQQQKTESTYHYRHTGRLHNNRRQNQQTENTPPILTQPFPARENNQVCNNAHTLQHDGKGHQKPDRPPHRAEVSIFAMAVFALGEAFAGIR